MNWVGRIGKQFAPLLALTGIFLLAGVLFFEFAPGASAAMGEEMLRMVANVIGGITGIYVWAIGQLLFVVIQALLVVATFNNFVHAPPVVDGWKIVRDVCNMFFVLILLVIAIGTILQQDKYHWTKLMPQFVSAAILINFSKVICGVIIDLAQVIMLTFVEAFKGAAGANFTVALGIPKILAASKNITTIGDTTDQVTFLSIAATYLLAAIFVTVGLIVITIMTLILLMRIIALWFLIILSPFAFMFAVLPDTETYAKKWWTQFTNYVIVGPAMAFFLWLSLTIIQTQAGNEKNAKNISAGSILYTNNNQAQKAGGAASAGSSLSTGAQAGLAEIGTLDGVLSFLIGIGLMIGSLMAAQEMGVAGSNMAKNAIGDMQKWAKGEKGPSPMRWMKERYDAYKEVGTDRRKLKAKEFGIKAADTVAGIKKTGAALVRTPVRFAASHVLQKPREYGERFDRWMNAETAPNVRRVVGGTLGHIWGGKQWRAGVNRWTEGAKKGAVDSDAKATKLRSQAAEERASGTPDGIKNAVKYEAQAERALLLKDTFNLGASLNNTRTAVPTATYQIGKLLATGATGGMLGGLNGAMIASGTFYGPTAAEALYASGQDQSIGAETAFVKLVNEQKKLVENLPVTDKKAIAFGYKKSPVSEQAAALQSLVEKKQLSDSEKKLLPELHRDIEVRSNKAIANSIKAEVVKDNPVYDKHDLSLDAQGQPNNQASRDELANILRGTKWDGVSNTLSDLPEAVERLANALQTFSSGNDKEKSLVTATLKNMGKDQRVLLNKVREKIGNNIVEAQAPGGNAIDPQTGEFTDQHKASLQTYFSAGGKAETVFNTINAPINAPAGQGVPPVVLNYLSQTIQQKPNDAAKMIASLPASVWSNPNSDIAQRIAREATPGLIGAINRNAKSDDQKNSRDEAFAAMRDNGRHRAANNEARAAIDRMQDQVQP